VKSPIAGLVVVRDNEDAAGGMFFGGMSLPEYQEGDQVNPGNIVAQVIDITQMEIATRVSESGRDSVKAGEIVQVSVDALPGATLAGKVKEVAGMSGGDFFDTDSEHKFDVTVRLDSPDTRLRPGFTTHLVILGDHLDHALSVPRQAVFEKDGKPVVYAKTGHGFESREIKIRNVTEGFAVIDGLQEGTQVALVNPEKKSTGPAKTGEAAATPAMGGGAP
jgi:HlyD family secretion protein